ncbi:hypothetical protein PsYK624_171800 [Phanerochaete sordida]|uniref:Uncharacterized protein n=1 Tax=Phanerochaete sordida TaxID=48140 RepID=A0A9P3GS46_9APHY|nr:hypothetical protein PsYK624_171800 [Phanerochaete sordida]
MECWHHQSAIYCAEIIGLARGDVQLPQRVPASRYMAGPNVSRAETCWSADGGVVALAMYHDEPTFLCGGMTRTFDIHSFAPRTWYHAGAIESAEECAENAKPVPVEPCKSIFAEDVNRSASCAW